MQFENFKFSGTWYVWCYIFALSIFLSNELDIDDLEKAWRGDAMICFLSCRKCHGMVLIGTQIMVKTLECYWKDLK